MSATTVPEPPRSPRRRRPPRPALPALPRGLRTIEVAWARRLDPDPGAGEGRVAPPAARRAGAPAKGRRVRMTPAGTSLVRWPRRRPIVLPGPGLLSSAVVRPCQDLADYLEPYLGWLQLVR